MTDTTVNHGSSEVEDPRASKASPVAIAFASLAALFEQSVTTAQISAQDHIQVARAFELQLAQLIKTLDPSSLGAFTFHIWTSLHL